jgi:hypothetical protein
MSMDTLRRPSPDRLPAGAKILLPGLPLWR